ncbi:uncharacterized protein LOC143300741 isoform X2 [Babylonia areolata]|uniref:uncharacterized protein LOC143300741 isoform X2 n=1 Tax=Babylonia areolata TaxID=304850 RepID=UPI003FD53B45
MPKKRRERHDFDVNNGFDSDNARTQSSGSYQTHPEYYHYYYPDAGAHVPTPTRAQLAAYDNHAYSNPGYAMSQSYMSLYDDGNKMPFSNTWDRKKRYAFTDNSNSHSGSDDTDDASRKRGMSLKCKVTLAVLVLAIFIAAAISIGVTFSVLQMSDNRTGEETTPDATVPTLEVSLRVTNREYSADLEDPTSDVYLNTKREMEDMLDLTLRNSDVDGMIDYVEVTRFRNGSLITDFIVHFLQKVIQEVKKLVKEPERFQEAIIGGTRKLKENNQTAFIVDIQAISVTVKFVTTTSTSAAPTTTTTTATTTTTTTTTEPTTTTAEPTTTTTITAEPTTTTTVTTTTTAEPTTTTTTTAEPTTITTTTAEPTTTTTTAAELTTTTTTIAEPITTTTTPSTTSTTPPATTAGTSTTTADTTTILSVSSTPSTTSADTTTTTLSASSTPSTTSADTTTTFSTSTTPSTTIPPAATTEPTSTITTPSTTITTTTTTTTSPSSSAAQPNRTTSAAPPVTTTTSSDDLTTVLTSLASTTPGAEDDGDDPVMTGSLTLEDTVWRTELYNTSSVEFQQLAQSVESEVASYMNLSDAGPVFNHAKMTAAYPGSVVVEMNFFLRPRSSLEDVNQLAVHDLLFMDSGSAMLTYFQQGRQRFQENNVPALSFSRPDFRPYKGACPDWAEVQKVMSRSCSMTYIQLMKADNQHDACLLYANTIKCAALILHTQNRSCSVSQIHQRTHQDQSFVHQQAKGIDVRRVCPESSFKFPVELGSTAMCKNPEILVFIAQYVPMGHTTTFPPSWTSSIPHHTSTFTPPLWSSFPHSSTMSPPPGWPSFPEHSQGSDHTWFPSSPGHSQGSDHTWFPSSPGHSQGGDHTQRPSSPGHSQGGDHTQRPSSPGHSQGGDHTQRPSSPGHSQDGDQWHDDYPPNPCTASIKRTSHVLSVLKSVGVQCDSQNVSHILTNQNYSASSDMFKESRQCLEYTGRLSHGPDKCYNLTDQHVLDSCGQYIGYFYSPEMIPVSQVCEIAEQFIQCVSKASGCTDGETRRAFIEHLSFVITMKKILHVDIMPGTNDQMIRRILSCDQSGGSGPPVECPKWTDLWSKVYWDCADSIREVKMASTLESVCHHYINALKCAAFIAKVKSYGHCDVEDVRAVAVNDTWVFTDQIMGYNATEQCKHKDIDLIADLNKTPPCESPDALKYIAEYVCKGPIPGTTSSPHPGHTSRYPYWTTPTTSRMPHGSSSTYQLGTWTTSRMPHGSSSTYQAGTWTTSRMPHGSSSTYQPGTWTTSRMPHGSSSTYQEGMWTTSRLPHGPSSTYRHSHGDRTASSATHTWFTTRTPMPSYGTPCRALTERAECVYNTLYSLDLHCPVDKFSRTLARYNTTILPNEIKQCDEERRKIMADECFGKNATYACQNDTAMLTSTHMPDNVCSWWYDSAMECVSSKLDQDRCPLSAVNAVWRRYLQLIYTLRHSDNISNIPLIEKVLKCPASGCPTWQEVQKVMSRNCSMSYSQLMKADSEQEACLHYSNTIKCAALIMHTQNRSCSVSQIHRRTHQDQSFVHQQAKGIDVRRICPESGFKFPVELGSAAMCNNSETLVFIAQYVPMGHATSSPPSWTSFSPPHTTKSTPYWWSSSPHPTTKSTPYWWSSSSHPTTKSTPYWWSSSPHPTTKSTPYWWSSSPHPTTKSTPYWWSSSPPHTTKSTPYWWSSSPHPTTKSTPYWWSSSPHPTTKSTPYWWSSSPPHTTKSTPYWWSSSPPHTTKSTPPWWFSSSRPTTMPTPYWTPSSGGHTQWQADYPPNPCTASIKRTSHVLSVLKSVGVQCDSQNVSHILANQTYSASSDMFKESRQCLGYIGKLSSGPDKCYNLSDQHVMNTCGLYIGYLFSSEMIPTNQVCSIAERFVQCISEASGCTEGETRRAFTEHLSFVITMKEILHVDVMPGTNDHMIRRSLFCDQSGGGDPPGECPKWNNLWMKVYEDCADSIREVKNAPTLESVCHHYINALKCAAFIAKVQRYGQCDVEEIREMAVNDTWVFTDQIMGYNGSEQCKDRDIDLIADLNKTPPCESPDALKYIAEYVCKGPIPGTTSSPHPGHTSRYPYWSTPTTSRMPHGSSSTYQPGTWTTSRVPHGSSSTYQAGTWTTSRMPHGSSTYQAGTWTTSRVPHGSSSTYQAGMWTTSRVPHGSSSTYWHSHGDRTASSATHTWFTTRTPMPSYDTPCRALTKRAECVYNILYSLDLHCPVDKFSRTLARYNTTILPNEIKQCDEERRKIMADECFGKNATYACQNDTAMLTSTHMPDNVCSWWYDSAMECVSSKLDQDRCPLSAVNAVWRRYLQLIYTLRHSDNISNIPLIEKVLKCPASGCPTWQEVQKVMSRNCSVTYSQLMKADNEQEACLHYANTIKCAALILHTQNRSCSVSQIHRRTHQNQSFVHQQAKGIDVRRVCPESSLKFPVELGSAAMCNNSETLVFIAQYIPMGHTTTSPPSWTSFSPQHNTMSPPASWSSSPHPNTMSPPASWSSSPHPNTMSPPASWSSSPHPNTMSPPASWSSSPHPNTMSPPPSWSSSPHPNTMSPPPSWSSSPHPNTMSPPPSWSSSPHPNTMSPPPSWSSSHHPNTMSPPPSWSSSHHPNTMSPPPSWSSSPHPNTMSPPVSWSSSPHPNTMSPPPSWSSSPHPNTMSPPPSWSSSPHPNTMSPPPSWSSSPHPNTMSPPASWSSSPHPNTTSPPYWWPSSPRPTTMSSSPWLSPSPSPEGDDQWHANYPPNPCTASIKRTGHVLSVLKSVGVQCDSQNVSQILANRTYGMYEESRQCHGYITSLSHGPDKCYNLTDHRVMTSCGGYFGYLIYSPDMHPDSMVCQIAEQFIQCVSKASGCTEGETRRAFTEHLSFIITMKEILHVNVMPGTNDHMIRRILFCDQSGVERPGVCPPPSAIMGICVFDPAVNCLNDSECQTGRKCCSEGCNKVCKDPIQESTTYSPYTTTQRRPDTELKFKAELRMNMTWHPDMRNPTSGRSVSAAAIIRNTVDAAFAKSEVGPVYAYSSVLSMWNGSVQASLDIYTFADHHNHTLNQLLSSGTNFVTDQFFKGLGQLSPSHIRPLDIEFFQPEDYHGRKGCPSYLELLDISGNALYMIVRRINSSRIVSMQNVCRLYEDALAASMLTTAEFRECSVEQLYQLFLDNDADVQARIGLPASLCEGNLTLPQVNKSQDLCTNPYLIKLLAGSQEPCGHTNLSTPVHPSDAYRRASNAMRCYVYAVDTFLPPYRRCSRESIIQGLKAHPQYLHPSYVTYLDSKVALTEDHMVLVHIDGKWSKVCGTGWDDSDATVACRSLGFHVGYSSQRYNADIDGQFGSLSDPVSNMECSGQEMSLLDCAYKRSDYCPERSAGAICYMSAPVYEIVSDKEGTSYGYVKRTVGDRSGFVKAGWMDKTAASLICRAAGYPYGGTPFQHPLPEIDMGPSRWINNAFSCDGEARNIEECMSGPSWAYHVVQEHSNGSFSYSDVEYFKPIKVFCFSSNVHLHNSLFNSTGIVLVDNGTDKGKHEEKYLGICRKGFNNFTASLVCKALGLGFESGVALGYQPFKFYVDKYNYFNVSCNGTEKELHECHNATASGKYCNSGFAAVRCTPRLDTVNETVPDMTVKLDHDNQTVLVYKDNQWGYICASNWTDAEAEQVCRSMAFEHGLTKTKYTHETFLPFLVHNVSCAGADSWEECTSKDVDSDVCAKQNPARVFCYNQTDMPVYSLYNGQDAEPSYGWVFVTREQTMGRLCAYFSPETLHGVLCRQLGYIDGEEYRGGLPEPPEGLPLWSTSFYDCGKETRWLETCRSEPWGRGDWHVTADHFNGSHEETREYFCYHPGIKTICYNETVKVHSGYFNTSGVLEVAVSGEYRHVCAQRSGYTQQAADVVCRSLTHSPTSSAIMVRKNVFMFNSKPRVHVNFSCDGTEENVDQCMTIISDNPYSCSSYAEREVAVVCYEGGLPADGITDWTIGVQDSVLVKQFGLWGHVCSQSWTHNEAAAVCKSLGHDSGVSISAGAWGTRLAQWVSAMSCPPNAQGVLQCSVTMKDYTLPQGSDYSSCHAVRAKCFNESEVPDMFFVDNGMLSSSRPQGRVAVTYNGTTSYFCSSTVSSTEGYDTLCRLMGYPRGGEKLDPASTSLPEPVTYQTGWEGHLNCGQWDRYVHYMSCFQGWNLQNMYYQQHYSSPGGESVPSSLSWCGQNVPAIACFDSEDYRLFSTHKDSSEGLLLVWNQGETAWEQVCRSGFSGTEANAACRQLGFPEGGWLVGDSPNPDLYYSMGDRRFQCSGAPGETLSTCSTNTTTCSNEYEAVWLKCESSVA